MALSIKDPQADKLARELAHLTGESLTEAIIHSLEERLFRKRRTQTDIKEQAYEIEKIVKRFNQRPVLDSRSPDEILSYDEHGLPQ